MHPRNSDFRLASALVAMIVLLSSPGVLAQSPALYWLDNTDLLSRMDLDTRQTEGILQIQRAQYDQTFIDIAIDSESGHVYWADWPEQTPPEGWYLLRSNLLGTRIDTLFSSASASPPSTGVCLAPYELAVDIPNNKFYWTFSMWGPDGICEGDLTTGSIEQIIPAGNTWGIAIDSEGDKLYFSKQTEIIRCNLDGSEPDTLVTEIRAPEENSVFSLLGVNLAVDTIHDALYWAADDAVWRSSLDGGNPEIVVNGDFYRLAVDGRSDSIFLTDSTGIYRSGLDGTGLERIVEQSWPGHLAVYRPSEVTGTDGIEGVPERSGISQAYPNPFDHSTTISYNIPEASGVTLVVYDVLGRQVRELVSGTKPAGTYEVSFDATGLPTGVYVYRLQAGRYVETKRGVVVR